MGKLMYALFVMLDGFSIGASLFGVWAAARILYLPSPTKGMFGRLTRRRQRYILLAFAGYAITASILLSRVVITREGTLDSNLWTYAYNTGLAIAGTGFAGLAKSTLDELVNREMDFEPATDADREENATTESEN